MSFERELTVSEKETAIAKGRLKAFEFLDENPDINALKKEFLDTMRGVTACLDNFHPDFFTNSDCPEINRNNDKKSDSELKRMLLSAFKYVRVMKDLEDILVQKEPDLYSGQITKSYQSTLAQAETVYRSNGEKRHCHPKELAA